MSRRRNLKPTSRKSVMKTLVKIASAFAALSIVLPSCTIGEPDSAKNKRANHLYVGTKEYVIDRGVMVQYSDPQGEINSKIAMYGNSLHYNEQTDTFEGDGLYLYFELRTTSEDKVDNGLYSYYYADEYMTKTKGAAPDFTFTDASSYFILKGNDYVRDHFMEGSNITIKNNGGNCTISIDGSTYSAGSVSGTFSGYLKAYYK